MIHICCVQVNNYCERGKDYVNILYDMVKRNMPDVPYKFSVFTDDVWGYNSEINLKIIQDPVSGWWNKLYLFKHGIFLPDELVIYFDLDTLITGPLDDILDYKGRFAILYNAYWQEHPKRWQSSVMMWRGGFGAHLWDKWINENQPHIPGGDQHWIMRHVPKA
ncbi:MAG: hypothetical protein ACOCTM_04565, partial [Bacteroidota bacterium]